MLTLTLPDDDQTHYPRSNFIGMDNLLRITELNRRDFREVVTRDIFVLEDEHVLVGLLRMMTIDPEWSLEQVVAQARFRANSLCSLFKITCINRVGEPIENGFYRNGTVEQWTLIDNNKRYVEGVVDLDTMRPVVPLYSTVTKRGYKHSILQPVLKQKGPDFAIMGIDPVELAVGWWRYMQYTTGKNEGISAYLCQHPLFVAQLMHNQLSLINIMYEFLTKEKSFDQIVETDVVSFTTMNEEKLLKEYLTHILNDMTGPRLKSFNHLISKFGSVYRRSQFNYYTGGRMQLFNQSRWSWEPAALKLLVIYLSVANRMGYRASDVNTNILRATHSMRGNYGRITDSFSRKHILELLAEVEILNKENMKY